MATLLIVFEIGFCSHTKQQLLATCVWESLLLMVKNSFNFLILISALLPVRASLIVVAASFANLK